MTSSPSEFLTFFRTASRSQALRQQCLSKRTFTSSIRQFAREDKPKSDIGGGDKETRHALEKGFDPNTQTHQTKEGVKSRAQGEGGVATEQKDPGNSATKKAKEEFPEAPTTIGFQDERGGKGH